MGLIRSQIQYATSREPQKYRVPVSDQEEGQLEYGWIRGWDDLRFPFTRDKQGQSSLPDFDFTNLGLLFPSGDTSEIVYIIAQFPHGRISGSNIRPHIHYLQTEETVPTFKIEYKWYNNGEEIPALWTTLSTNSVIFDYSSGSNSILQILNFPEIEGSNISGVSSILDIKIYRDDSDIVGDVLVKEFDIHFLSDNIGSFQEFTK